MPFLPTITPAFTTQLIELARAAGAAILAVYHAPESIAVEHKADHSPLTQADLAAHALIARQLPLLLDIPLISEESALPGFAERQSWPAYWLIDPLDGTKEFIDRNGQFTVNIALVMQGKPVLGVVHVSVGDVTYLGVDAAIAVEGKNRAEKFEAGIKVADLHCRPLAERQTSGQALDVLASQRHGGEAVAELLERLQTVWPGPIQRLNAGSSLKFCWIAEGRADFYQRLAPTSEWDTAAAQAVLQAAGGAVVNAETLLPLRCNQGESILNPSFFAWGDNTINWRAWLL